MAARRIAVLDIGKTNAKVVVHDLLAGVDLFERRRPSRSLPRPPYPHLDIDGLWRFIAASLAEAAAAFPIDAVSVTTHGASIALLGEGGLAAPVLDYEAPLADTLPAYRRLRPPFAETFSPALPAGLNAGAQIHHVETAHPGLWAKTRTILTYPQYWGWRLTGVAAADPTSLGCHTDLWAPATATPSSLAIARGWADRLAPLRSPFDVLGGVTAAAAAETGLRAGTPVHVGIHDSNASLLPHLLGRKASFAVVSTGTWVIAFAVGAPLDGLDPARDGLANVDAFGRPVPSARFMGGREFEQLAPVPADPQAADVNRWLADGIPILPCFSAGSGPYPDREGRWLTDPESLAPAARSAAASLYLAAMTATALEVAHAAGETIIEGPFARNAVFAEALAGLTGRPVRAVEGSTGTAAGAALLALGPTAAITPPPGRRIDPDSRYHGLAARWRASFSD